MTATGTGIVPAIAMSIGSTLKIPTTSSTFDGDTTKKKRKQSASSEYYDVSDGVSISSGLAPIGATTVPQQLLRHCPEGGSAGGVREAEAVELTAQVAVKCMSFEGSDRPTMADIVTNLENALSLGHQILSEVRPNEPVLCSNLLLWREAIGGRCKLR
uniref:Uncharacterized protein n=1 Tax=Nelumbo nucifera TaxID=4432 RepID=A0A822ZB79_NELNU|nr:TPA_asm: hypothetical protein HUJ06_014619 [Nelumbo nucifera]